MTFKELAILLPLTAAAAAGIGLPVQVANATSRCDEQPVFSIAAANLEIGEDTITLSAYGTASTMGWKFPALKRLATSGEPTTIIYEFVGCPPQFGAEVMTPISAKVTLAKGAASAKHIVIKAKSDSRTLDVAEFRGKLHAGDPQAQ